MDARTKTIIATRPFKVGYSDDPGYRPEFLLDMIMARFGLKNDAALCRKLEVAPPVVSKIRKQKLSVSDGIMVRIHDTCGLSIKEIRDLMGVSQY
jgi:plasmid maintenance system antidote protein VapI